MTCGWTEESSSSPAGARGSDARRSARVAEEGANVVIADLDEAGGEESVGPGREGGRRGRARGGRHLDRGGRSRRRRAGARAFRHRRRAGQQRGHRSAGDDRQLERTGGELGSCDPGQPQERVSVLAGRDPGHDRQRPWIHRQHRIDRGDPRVQRRLVRGREGRDARLHPPGRTRARDPRRARQLRVTRFHAHADEHR